MFNQSTSSVYFAIPGDINHCTGGYEYGRQLMMHLTKTGINIKHLQLSGQFPNPDTQTLNETDAIFTALPDETIIIVDGLALGVMDKIAEKHKNRLRLIGLCHHPLMMESGLSIEQQQYLHRSERAALNACIAIITTSKKTQSILIEQFSIAQSKITVAYPGTEKQTFASCTGNTPQLLTLATLTRRKGHDILIEALSQIRHLPWHARFVGGDNFDPNWAQHLKNKISALDLDSRIECTGSLKDVTTEFLNADLFVLSSRFEGYGMAFAEALSYGLPIIATNTGAIPEVVPASAGTLIAPDDIDGLAKNLVDLLTNTEKRNALQQGARAAAQTLPSWKDTAHIVATIIHQLKTE